MLRVRSELGLWPRVSISGAYVDNQWVGWFDHHNASVNGRVASTPTTSSPTLHACLCPPNFAINDWHGFRQLTCPSAAARWDPPGRGEQRCHHLLWKQRDMPLYLEQVEHQGERRPDGEEHQTPADEVGRADVVQGAVGVAEHRGDDGHHLVSFGCHPVGPWRMLGLDLWCTRAAPAAVLQAGHLALDCWWRAGGKRWMNNVRTPTQIDTLSATVKPDRNKFQPRTVGLTCMSCCALRLMESVSVDVSRISWSLPLFALLVASGRITALLFTHTVVQSRQIRWKGGTRRCCSSIPNCTAHSRQAEPSGLPLQTTITAVSGETRQPISARRMIWREPLGCRPLVRNRRAKALQEATELKESSLKWKWKQNCFKWQLKKTHTGCFHRGRWKSSSKHELVLNNGPSESSHDHEPGLRSLPVRFKSRIGGSFAPSATIPPEWVKSFQSSAQHRHFYTGSLRQGREPFYAPAVFVKVCWTPGQVMVGVWLCTSGSKPTGPLARQSLIVQTKVNKVQRPLDVLQDSHTAFKNTETSFARTNVYLWQVNVGQNDNKPFIQCIHAAEKKGVNACFAFPSVPRDMRGKEDGTDCVKFWKPLLKLQR